jgi:hypothetical protein
MGMRGFRGNGGDKKGERRSRFSIYMWEEKKGFTSGGLKSLRSGRARSVMGIIGVIIP